MRGIEEAQHGIGIVRIAEAHAYESASCCSAWAKGFFGKRLVVRYSIPLPIFLVVKGNCYGIGLRGVARVAWDEIRSMIPVGPHARIGDPFGRLKNLSR